MNRSYLDAYNIPVYHDTEQLLQDLNNNDELEYVYDDRNISKEETEEWQKVLNSNE